MALQLPRGTKDIPPGEMLQRQQLIDVLRGVFALYGYLPLETPVLERYDTLASKYAGGAEILKETFKLKDQGNRELALRYDLTVPMCRFIAMNPALKMPFKRYQIAPVFRDGPIKLGRYRQFTQCDVDVVGVKAMLADAEMVMIAKAVFFRLQLDAVVKVNSRKLLNSIMETAGVKKEKTEAVILCLDKLEKFGKDAVAKEMEGKGVPAGVAKKIFAAVMLDGTNAERLKGVAAVAKTSEGKEGVSEMQELLTLTGDERVEFVPSLARGLAYYTGTVYEAFLRTSAITSAVAAGGRYDRMISDFLGGKQEYPAVGISFGLDVIMDALKENGKMAAATETTVYVIPIKRTAEAMRITQQFREAGINADTDLGGRSISKNLNYANGMGIPFVAFVGEKELQEKRVKLRDMRSGEESLFSVAEAVMQMKNILLHKD